MAKPAQPPSIPDSLALVVKSDNPIEVKRRRDLLAGQLKSVQDDLERTRRRVSSLETQVEGCEKELETLDARLSSFSKEERISALEGEVARLTGELMKREVHHHVHQPSGLSYTYTTDTFAIPNFGPSGR